MNESSKVKYESKFNFSNTVIVSNKNPVIKGITKSEKSEDTDKKIQKLIASQEKLNAQVKHLQQQVQSQALQLALQGMKGTSTPYPPKSAPQMPPPAPIHKASSNLPFESILLTVNPKVLMNMQGSIHMGLTVKEDVPVKELLKSK